MVRLDFRARCVENPPSIWQHLKIYQTSKNFHNVSLFSHAIYVMIIFKNNNYNNAPSVSRFGLGDNELSASEPMLCPSNGLTEMNKPLHFLIKCQCQSEHSFTPYLTHLPLRVLTSFQVSKYMCVLPAYPVGSN